MTSCITTTAATITPSASRIGAELASIVRCAPSARTYVISSPRTTSPLRSDRMTGYSPSRYCCPSGRHPSKPLSLQVRAEAGLRAQPHLVELAVAERHRAVDVDDRDADRELLEHALQAQLGRLAIGDVDDDDADAGDLVLVAHREPAGEHVAHAARARHLAGHLALEHGLAGREHLLVDRHDHVRELGQRLVDPAAEVVLDRPAVDLRQGGVDAHEAQLAVDEREPDGGTFADHVE